MIPLQYLRGVAEENIKKCTLMLTGTRFETRTLDSRTNALQKRQRAQ